MGKSSGGGSGVDYAYNQQMANIATVQNTWAGYYFDTWNQHFRPLEIAQANANMELLPYEKELNLSQIQAATELIPQQAEASKQYLQMATEGVDVNERIGLAGADVASSWKDVNAATARENARMGVNPNSGKYQGIQSAMDTQQAAQLAGAKTQARVGAEEENYNRLRDAIVTNPANSILQGVGSIRSS